jgi:hypothetical protein
MTSHGFSFPPANFNLPLDNDAIMSGNPARMAPYMQQLVVRLDSVLEQLSAGIYGERGEWTPVAQGATSAGSGTYEKQVGTYVCSGSMCWFTMQLHFDNSNHTGTGNLQVTGLPFTSEDTTDAEVVFTYYDSQSGSEVAGIALMDPNVKMIKEFRTAAGSVVAITADHELHVTGVYRIETL